ncbi:myelin-associated glycoprotein-like [Puntigrus tetrazona]|uniref:myelin-associated glycoprotein-like n=1 Tax=Puntigrus tetrazona TaxID=1606681 RepID=UPI001C8A435E|nr:myelin-associated glycoprotein-like [Puntigrus tetrazona]XP_043115764.1 myelin-associated glycoprotein-like [Puntigrus tetrazona]XP_043115765.1 myelin-associated glycoprotein-like [Puntigrus tetrazona]
MIFWSCLLSLSLWLRVSPANANEWEAAVNASVVGLSGSCVVVSCEFSYPAKGRTYTEFTGIWYKTNEESVVFHRDHSKIIEAFKGRTSLTGDLSKNDCSLNISSLKRSDEGSFMFRVDIKDLDKYTYKKDKEKVSIKVEETPKIPSVSVEEEVTSGKRVTATCAVYHSCPSNLPRVTWSHDGTHSRSSQPQHHGQWLITYYNLTFTPSREDHEKQLSCSAQFEVKTVTGNRTLNVKYPPYNVRVTTKASVKENDSVELTCSSDSNPPASSYRWFSSDGTTLGNKQTYKLERASRYTEAISCTAINTEGKASSGPQKINVLYPPYNVRVTTKASVKENDSVELTCSSDSNPPASSYRWFSSNGTTLGNKQTYKLERASRYTEAISCTAINTEGNNTSGQWKPSEAPQHGIIIYIAVASAIVLILACILVYVVRRRSGKSTEQLHAMKNEQNGMEITKNKNDHIFQNLGKGKEGSDEDIYTNCPEGHIYGNTEFDGKAFSSDYTSEDEAVYINT